MRNKRFLFSYLILLISILIPLTSSLGEESLAEYPAQKIGVQFSFCQPCADATYVSISSIITPSSLEIINENMTSIGSGEFCYNYTTTEKGTYDFKGKSDGCSNTFAVRVPSTTTGEVLTPAKATAYSIILILSILIFAGILYFGLAMPDGNKRDEMSGYILAVSNLKYLKYFLLCLSYVFLVWISYFSWMMVYSFLDFEFLSNIFRFIFTALAITTLPLFILFTYLTIANLIRDSKIADSLMRGLRIR